MPGLELVLLLLTVSAGLRLVADRLTIPYAAILVVGGLLLAFVPGLPRVTPPPGALFLIFVPPLLYWGSVSFSIGDFRRQIGPIAGLAVLLVLVSTAAVAIVARTVHPSFTWPAAITLGAIVSPPDPVAVLSLTRTLRAPRWIESILEGEGLANDATAIVVYRLAIAAAVTDTFSPSRAAIDFLLAGAGGIVVGLVVGVIVAHAQRLARSVPPVSTTVSLLTPFASFLAGEHLGVSGVLSVVATGLYASRTVGLLIGPEARLLSVSTWTVVTYLLESLIFILVGLELPYVLRALNRFTLSMLIREAAIISMCAVLVRLVFVFPGTYVFRSVARAVRGSREPLPSWRSVLFVAWAGLRGGDSLVLALSLPLQTASGARFPAHDQIVFDTFGVIFFTLVLQGPTLMPMIRWLGLRVEEGETDEESHARLEVAEAGLRKLDDPLIATSKYPEVLKDLRQRHPQRARREEISQPDEQRAAEYRRVRSAMLAAEQDAVVELRSSGTIANSVMRRIQRELDLEAMQLDTKKP